MGKVSCERCLKREPVEFRIAPLTLDYPNIALYVKHFAENFTETFLSRDAGTMFKKYAEARIEPSSRSRQRGWNGKPHDLRF